MGIIVDNQNTDSVDTPVVSIEPLPAAAVTTKNELWSMNNIAIFISIITSTIFVLAGVNAISKYWYYGINLSLFTYDSKYIFIDIFGFVLTWLSIVGVPFLLHKFMSTSGHLEQVFIKSLYFIFVFVGINYFFFDLIHHAFKTFIPLDIPKPLTFILITIALHFVFFRLKSLENIAIHLEALKTEKKMLFKTVTVVVPCILSLAITLVVYLSIFLITLLNIIGVPQHNIHNQYSIIVQSDLLKIVLFKADNKLFVADYIADEQGNCTIYTKQYQVIPFENMAFENKIFKEVTIDQENLKPK